MRYVHNQSGAALIILLTIFILGSITFLLSQLNERAHYLLDDQAQTIRVLTQAKESLLGFAATYAQNPDHEVKLQGYLPCPDKDGDGSAEPPCESAGQTVIGRFPWRTLGLPPLRDGSGECLWYAVSGNFKDNPKQVLTSDSNGLLVIKNAKDEIITGQTVPDRAIAVIFAPGRFTKNQNREVTGTLTECGSIIEGTLIEPINRVRNYLDKYNFDGVVVDNATANNAIFISDSGFFASSPLIPNATPVFINAPPVYETYLHPQDDTERLDRANPTFNDTLITIAPEDFKPVYRMMDYQVATQVRACLDRYAQKSLYNFMNSLQTDIGSTDGSFIFVEKFLEITNLPKINATVEEKQQEKIRILTEIKKNIANKNITYPKYPWPSYVNPSDYSDDENNYFGRIPTQILKNSSFKTTGQPHLLKTRDSIINLFKDNIININSLLSESEYIDKFKKPLEILWSDFENHFTILKQWPVDPQTPFLILNLHDLEYETLKNDPQVSKEELITKVLDTFKDKDIEKEFFDFYQGNDPTTRIKNISTKVDLIEDLKTFSTRESVLQKLQRYQCFFFDETNPTPSKSKWWWWQGWQDKVFFAIHSDYSLNNNIGSSLTFNTPADKDTINAEMLVLVAGRPLNGQQRSQPEQQIKITNYLEGQNSDGDTRFVHAPVTSIFNDVVL
ncbi:hypothetical protein THII_2073 [Thioploca ingrica]|uniref:Uncharacterized protein n=1 Tax=Thioploca ingrica TaxID=40754 RepID=A0A090AMD4_9GAMM|nr:hypothetical protein THII_2073 [Thioploca ingrica]